VTNVLSYTEKFEEEMLVCLIKGPVLHMSYSELVKDCIKDTCMVV
jgi:hypothetical protein